MKLISLILLFLSIVNAQAYDFDHAELVYAIDGDTVKVNLCNTHPLLGEKISIRVKGIDTPEIRPKDTPEAVKGLEARSFVQSELSSAKKIQLVGCERGKYFRLACNISYDGKDLATELLKRGLAKSVDYK